MAVELNYKLIGLRIRESRQRCGYTQEYVSECADISTQHCSAIETANTKLSLPCLVRICNVLEISPNDLLLDSLNQATPQLTANIAEVFSACTNDEIYLMLAVADSLKKSLRLKDITTGEKYHKV